MVLCGCRVRASMSALGISCRRPSWSASVRVRSVSAARTPLSTRPSVEGQRHRLEAGRDAPARLQDRLDDRDPGEAAAEARQLGADPLAAVADPVALQAERLLHVLEDLPASPRVPRTGQGHLDEPLVLEASNPCGETAGGIRAGEGRRRPRRPARWSPRPRSTSTRSESGWNGWTLVRWWTSLPSAQMRSVPLLDARSCTVAGSASVKSAAPRHTEAPVRRRAALDPEARLRARREQGPPSGRVPGLGVEGLAGPPGPGDERGRRLGGDRPEHLPADQQPGRPLDVGHGPIEPEPLGREQARHAGPSRSGCAPRAGGSPRWGSASPGRPPPRPGRARPARRCTPARGAASRDRRARRRPAAGPAARAGVAANRGRRAARPGRGRGRGRGAGRPPPSGPACPRPTRPPGARPDPDPRAAPAPRSPASETPRAAATSTAAARTSGSGEPSLPDEPRRGPGQGRLAEVADRRGEHRAVLERIDQLEQLPRLRPSSPPGQSARAARRLAGVCDAVGDDPRPAGRAARRRRGRAATRGSRPRPPARAGRSRQRRRVASRVGTFSRIIRRSTASRTASSGSSSARSSAAAIASVRSQATVFAGRGAGRYPQ